MMPICGWRGSALLGIALFTLLATPHVSAFGTETALLALLPYRLPAERAPAGWTEQEQRASTNAALAFSAPAAERLATARGLAEKGRVIGLQQTFMPPAGAGLPAVTLLVDLYRNPVSASAIVATVVPPGGAGEAELLLPPGVNGARAVRVALRDGTGSGYVIAWSRGPLCFVVTFATPEPSALEVGEHFAAAADDHALAIGAMSAAAVYAPSDDSDELARATALDAVQLPETVVPSRFRRAGAYLWTNEQVVLDARDPILAAQAVVADEERITADVEFFADEGTRSVLSSVYTVFGDAAGAQSALQQSPLGSAGRQAIISLAPPADLGEEVVAFEAIVRWPQGDLRESYTVQWRHGNLLLAIVVNQAAGQGMPAFLGAAVSALDQTYLSPLQARQGDRPVIPTVGLNRAP
jgi:hypothetical protein